MSKVLIVEDESSIRVLLKKLVNDIGYNDILADSGELARDILNVNRDIDLIITDVVLGGISGLELVEFVRSQNKLMHIPIYVCSSQLTKEEVMPYLKKGIQLFMEKPIQGKKLQSHIIKLIEPDLSKTHYFNDGSKI
jgi:two-component system, chemotaxis family, chemotaxis protein CheY